MGTDPTFQYSSLLCAVQETDIMNTVGISVICLALLGAVLAQDDCCTKGCTNNCKIENAGCVNIPYISDCAKLMEACVTTCVGPCQCAEALEADCAGKTAKCEADANGDVVAIETCAAKEVGCLEVGALSCAGKDTQTVLAAEK